MDMISRFLAVVIITLTSHFAVAAETDAATLQLAADQALETGDIGAALEGYLGLVELQPENAEALELTANLAAELGLTELAIENWVKRVDLAVSRSNVDAAIQGNAQIALLFSIVPDWVNEKLAAASYYSDDQSDMVQAWQEMTAEAQAALEAGDAENALAAQEGALMVAIDSFGEEHWLTVSAHRDLGYLYRQLGMAAEAEEFYTIALVGADAILGEGHPSTLEINALIAELYSALGLEEESRLMMEMVAAGYESSLGAGHETSINARFSEVENQKSAGMYGAAMDSLMGLCATLELSHGAYHPDSVWCLESVASLNTTMGNYSDAESGYEQVIIRKSLSSTELDSSVLGVLSQVAEIYRISGQYQKSKDLLSGVIQTALQTGDVVASYTAKSYLGRVLNNEGDYEKAQLVMEEVLDYGLEAW